MEGAGVSCWRRCCAGIVIMLSRATASIGICLDALALAHNVRWLCVCRLCSCDRKMSENVPLFPLCCSGKVYLLQLFCVRTMHLYVLLWDLWCYFDLLLSLVAPKTFLSSLSSSSSQDAAVLRIWKSSPDFFPREWNFLPGFPVPL